MSRRSFLVGVGIVAFLALGLGTALVVLVRYEPHRYAAAPLPPLERQIERSREFVTEFFELIGATHGDREWYARFTDEQINSYLHQGFVQSGLSERLLPEGISEPRIVFEPQRIRLAFRYQTRLFSTVVSVAMRVWLPKGEPNVLALQLERFEWGVLPISAQWLLERISEVGRQNGIEVTWYRHNGHPVALLRFQTDQARSTLQLRAVQINQGEIHIQGRSTDGRAVSQLTGPPAAGE
jgi:hypothetical protein